MFPPGVRERAAAAAECHLQLAVEGLELSGHHALVSGRVVRIFRGDTALLDTPLTFSVPVALPDVGHPPSGISRLPWGALQRARVVEAFVDHLAAHPQAVYGMAMILDEASEGPRYPVGAPLPLVGRPGMAPWKMALAVAVVGLTLYLLLRTAGI